MIAEQQPLQGLVSTLKQSITLKLVFIIVLVLLLLLPSAWIDSLIRERSNRQDEMIADISDKWSGSQLVQGPVLVIPYNKTIKEIVNSKETYRTVVKNLYILPDNLNITADIASEKLKRGIFETVVYNSKINIPWILRAARN